MMGNTDKFDSIAMVYDTPKRAETAAVIADKIRVSIGGASGKTAIDYGCGTGLVGLRLLDMFRSVLFVDASKNMLAEVKRKNGSAQTLCADIMRGSRLPGTDYVLVVQTLLHEKDTRELLSRLSALLNDGGHLLIVDFDKNEEARSPDIHNGFNKISLADILTDLGLIIRSAETFYHGKDMLMGRDASLFLIDAEFSR
jgi:predicted TPR repeat methyltransferase